LSYSRDFTISELGAYSGGTNEISLIIESIEGGLFAGLMSAKRHKRSKYRSIPCYSKFNTKSGL
jgi:LytS/YehU family sensor histidine kinase